NRRARSFGRTGGGRGRCVVRGIGRAGRGCGRRFRARRGCGGRFRAGRGWGRGRRGRVGRETQTQRRYRAGQQRGRLLRRAQQRQLEAITHAPRRLAGPVHADDVGARAQGGGNRVVAERERRLLHAAGPEREGREPFQTRDVVQGEHIVL